VAHRRALEYKKAFDYESREFIPRQRRIKMLVIIHQLSRFECLRGVDARPYAPKRCTQHTKHVMYGTKLLLFIISQVRSAAMMMSHCSCTPTDILISREQRCVCVCVCAVMTPLQIIKCRAFDAHTQRRIALIIICPEPQVVNNVNGDLSITPFCIRCVFFNTSRRRHESSSRAQRAVRNVITQ